LQSIAELDRVHSGEHADGERARANVGLMHSVARIELVAPAEIVDLATGWRDGLLTDSGTGEELDRIMEELVLSMRKALGVAPWIAETPGLRTAPNVPPARPGGGAGEAGALDLLDLLEPDSGPVMNAGALPRPLRATDAPPG
jgi:hypothetical protein